MKRRYTAAAAMMMVMGLCASASAAFDENLNDYTLDTMVVEADAVKNKFGDTITEQSYYRTGGDVKVITRETNYKKSRGEQEKNSAYVVIFYATQINLPK